MSLTFLLMRQKRSQSCFGSHFFELFSVPRQGSFIAPLADCNCHGRHHMFARIKSARSP